MDEADRANQEVERGLSEALRQRRPEGPVATGRCLCCDEPVEEPRRWCDSICRDDWQRIQRR